LDKALTTYLKAQWIYSNDLQIAKKKLLEAVRNYKLW
jgi:argininosuccinate lyase